MNEDAAHDCLGDLGKLGVIQFTDVRTLLQSYFHLLFTIVVALLHSLSYYMYLRL